MPIHHAPTHRYQTPVGRWPGASRATVPGRFDPRRVFYIRSVEALQTQDLLVKRCRKNPTINNSEIECGGVHTDNGLVWLIDSVLLPQF